MARSNRQAAQTSDNRNERDKKADETNTDDEAIEEKPKRVISREEKAEEATDPEEEEKIRLQEEKRLKKEKKKAEEKRLMEELERLKREEEEISKAKAKQEEGGIVEREQEQPRATLPASNLRVPKRLTTQKIEAPVVKPKQAEVKVPQQTVKLDRESSEEIVVKKDVKQTQETTTPSIANDLQSQQAKIKKPTKLYQPQVKFTTGQPGQQPAEPSKPMPTKVKHEVKDDTDSDISFDAGITNKKLTKDSGKDQDWNVGGPSIPKKSGMPIGQFKPQTVGGSRAVNDDDWDA